MHKFYIYTKNNTIEERETYENQNRIAFYGGPDERSFIDGNSPAPMRANIQHLDVSELRLCNTSKQSLRAYVPQGTHIQQINGAYCASMKYVALPGSLLYVILEEHKKAITSLNASFKETQNKNVQLRKEIILLRNEIKELNANFDNYVQDNTSFVDKVKRKFKSFKNVL